MHRELLIWKQDYSAALARDIHYLPMLGWGCFLWGQWPWKHHCADWLWTTVLSKGFWLIWGVAEEQFQQCYQEQTEGHKGPVNSTGAPSVGPQDAWLWFRQLNWYSLMWVVFLFTSVCLYAWDHSWNGGNCVSVFTLWLKISLPLHLTTDWFDLANIIRLYYQLPRIKNIHHAAFHCWSHLWCKYWNED